MVFAEPAPRESAHSDCRWFIRIRWPICAFHFVLLSDKLGAADLTWLSNNWDNMFMERLMGSITIHRPVTAPAAVLALGNGFDFWAVHAAQKWPVCIQLTALQSLLF
jgi:hypothetical protein